MIPNTRKIPISGALLSSLYSKITVPIEDIKKNIKEITGEEITDKNLADLYKELGLDLETRNKPKYVFGKLLESNPSGTRFIVVRGAGYVIGSGEYDDFIYRNIMALKEPPLYDVAGFKTNMSYVMANMGLRTIDQAIKAYIAAGWTVVDQDKYYGSTIKEEYKEIEEEKFDLNTSEDAPGLPNGSRYKSTKTRLVMEVWGDKGYTLGSSSQKKAKEEFNL